MPDPVLTLLKYVFLAILYLFFLRVLRAVWVQLREPKVVPAPAAGTQPPEPPSGSEKLVVISPKEVKGREFVLGQEVTVGRADGVAIHLPEDTFVSQLHARVFHAGGDIFVEDLGSTNGTFLNGKQVTSAVPLRKGDKVTFGRTTLELARSRR